MRKGYLLFLLGLLVLFVFFYQKKNYTIGAPIDQLEGVEVYFNGSINHVANRNVAPNGYNLGLRWQCVEFVKRFYFEFFKHEMPNSYGHAKDFFDQKVKDGKVNQSRNLLQFSNPSNFKPQKYDILIFGKTSSNAFGHVAIISAVENHHIEIIQQNMGFFGSSREEIKLVFENNQWEIKHPKILGRLSVQP